MTSMTNTKRKRRRILAPLTIALSFGGLASCSLPQLDIMPRYGQLTLDGEVGVSATGVTARANTDDMALGDDEEVYGLRADFKLGSPHLVVMGQESSHDGTGTLTAELSQGGITIPLGATVASDLDVGLFSGVLFFDILPGDFWELGLGFGAGMIDLDATFEEVGGLGGIITTDETFYVPLVAVDAGLQFGNLELAALVQGMELIYQGDGGRYVDSDAFLRWRFLGGSKHLRVSLVGGYRYILLDVVYEDGSTDVEVDVSLSGPYAGLEITL